MRCSAQRHVIRRLIVAPVAGWMDEWTSKSLRDPGQTPPPGRRRADPRSDDAASSEGLVPVFIDSPVSVHASVMLLILARAVTP